VQVYPNPATGRFAVKLPAALAAGRPTLTLRNSLGQVVLAQAVTGPRTELDAQGPGTGMYALRLTGPGLAAVTTRVVLQ